MDGDVVGVLRDGGGCISLEGELLWPLLVGRPSAAAAEDMFEAGIVGGVSDVGLGSGGGMLVPFVRE